MGGSKSLAAFQAKGNPRKCAWTAVYRRLHHKGTANAATRKKKSRKIARSERSIAGLSLAELQKKRAEKSTTNAKAQKAAIAATKKKAGKKSWKKINCTILK